MQFATLYDPAALAIVGGGTIAATVLRTPLRDLIGGARALAVLGRRPFDGERLVRQLLDRVFVSSDTPCRANRQGVEQCV